MQGRRNLPCSYHRRVVMLILTRKIGESLLIGDDVEITVLSVRGSQVKLGVKAPKEIAVHREEIYQRIKALSESSDNEIR